MKMLRVVLFFNYYTSYGVLKLTQVFSFAITLHILFMCVWSEQDGEFGTGQPNSSGDLSSELEVDAFRRLFPVKFYERHLAESIRPDGRPLGRARDTSIALGFLCWDIMSYTFVLLMSLFDKFAIETWFFNRSYEFHSRVWFTYVVNIIGAVGSANGSALVKIGLTVIASMLSTLLSCSYNCVSENKA